jgi:hypothetical protein
VKRFSIALLAAAALLAQKGSPKFTVETCKLGSSHNCVCSRRYGNIQAKIVSGCEKQSGNAKEYAECMAMIPPFCNVVDHPTAWDEFGSEPNAAGWDPDNHRYNAVSKMGEYCSMACKSHDCKCADGPTCHFGHGEMMHDTRKKK